MNQKKPVVFLTRRLPESTETRMRELFDAHLRDHDTPLSHAELCAAVQSADVLVPTVTDRIDADVIAAAGDQLKLIASFGTGVDHIDLAAAKARGITVTNTPGVLTEDTADVAMALMLAVPRRIAEGNQVARSGEWTGWSPTGMLGHRINGKRLGIIGMGRIGTAVARRARGFGLSIHYHNRKPVHPETEAELEATYWDSLDQMLGRVDIVSVNCPHTPATNHLLTRELLSMMQPSAYLVNTSRGEVIDEAALADLLADRQIAGAGLDVYEDEPRITTALVSLPNVVLLPHIGSATIEGRLEMGDKVIINIQTFW
ncbi:MAG TPA: D-glycerate dehydrogenase, partial [Alphaproteobacteria bacterium]|nr:D-glycerate dehydrogenase [Alphaproteobacteria bacterium]